MGIKDTYHGLPVKLLFDSREYELHSRYVYKRDADREAKFLRRNKWLARIKSVTTPDGYRYAIYVRRRT